MLGAPHAKTNQQTGLWGPRTDWVSKWHVSTNCESGVVQETQRGVGADYTSRGEVIVLRSQWGEQTLNCNHRLVMISPFRVVLWAGYFPVPCYRWAFCHNLHQMSQEESCHCPCLSEWFREDNMLNLVLGNRLVEAESPFFWSVLLGLSGA